MARLGMNGLGTARQGVARLAEVWSGWARSGIGRAWRGMEAATIASDL